MIKLLEDNTAELKFRKVVPDYKHGGGDTRYDLDFQNYDIAKACDTTINDIQFIFTVDEVYNKYGNNSGKIEILTICVIDDKEDYTYEIRFRTTDSTYNKLANKILNELLNNKDNLSIQNILSICKTIPEFINYEKL